MLAFYAPGFWEIVVIGFLVLLFFGNRLPTLGRSLGKGIVEFKKGLSGKDEGVAPPVEDPREKPKALDYSPPPKS